MGMLHRVYKRPEETAGLKLFDPNCYEIRPVGDLLSENEYAEFLKSAYEPLGFMVDGILPVDGSYCFQLRFEEQLVAVFRLTPVQNSMSPYYTLPQFFTADQRDVPKLVEVNNVVVRKDFRATIVLGLMLQFCAIEAERRGFDHVVGVTRHQTLRYFVDFGVVPIDHEPWHLLGRPDLHDFVIYYDLTSEASREYMRERSRRYFHQQYVLQSVKLKCGTRTASILDESGAITC